MKKHSSPKKKPWFKTLFYAKEEKGFSLLEMVLVIGIVGVVSSTAIPMFRKYQINSDLNNTQALITQGISRARLLAQSNKNDDAWGFSAANGVLYEGSSYATRITANDEFYAIPASITVLGITDISFQKVTGKPSASGNITLLGFDGQQRIINIAVSDAGIAMNTNDLIIICHHQAGLPDETMYVSDDDLAVYLAAGDTTGGCIASSSVASSVSSSAGSAGSSASGGGSSGGGVSSTPGNMAPTISKGVLMLEPSAQAALNVTGNGTMTVAAGGFIQLNTSNPYAAKISANGSVVAPTLYTYGNPGTLVSGNGHFYTTLSSNVIPAADPFITLPVPATTTPVITNASYTSGTTTLNPGTYQGGIKGSSNANIILNPGTYYISSGGLSITGNATLAGNGVTIFVTGGGAVTLTGNGAVNLTAPTSGTYNKILIYQDRTYSNAMTITGNGTMNISGTIYAAKAPITVTGNAGTTTVGSLIVGLSLKVAGNGAVNVQ